MPNFRRIVQTLEALKGKPVTVQSVVDPKQGAGWVVHFNDAASLLNAEGRKVFPSLEEVIEVLEAEFLATSDPVQPEQYLCVLKLLYSFNLADPREYVLLRDIFEHGHISLERMNQMVDKVEELREERKEERIKKARRKERKIDSNTTKVEKSLET